MKNKILSVVIEKKYFFLIVAILYRLILDTIYNNITVPYFEYSGFVCNALPFQNILSWILLITCGFLTIPYLRHNYNILSFFIIIVYFYRLIPVTVIISYIDQPYEGLSCQFLYWILFFLLPLLLKFDNFNNIWKKNTLRSNDENVINLVLLVTSLIIIFISGFYAHFRLRFSLSDVYDLRLEARSFDMPTLLLYLWSGAKSVLPVILVYYLIKKKYFIASFVIFITLLDFSIDGLKGKFFYLFLCVILHYFYNGKYKYYIGFLFVLLGLICLLEYRIIGSQLLHIFFIRRVLFEPGLLDSYYFDYISNNGVLYYARGDVNIQLVIGEIYFDSPEMNSNNGLFSDAYMNLGMLGCILYPILFSIILRLLDSLFLYANKEIVFFVSIVMALTIGSSELTTCLVTHGLLFLFFVVYIVSKSNYNKMRVVNNN